MAVARDAGAAGARLAGAGFGGWAVAVCHPDTVEAVTEAMASIAGEAFRAEPSDSVGCPLVAPDTSCKASSGS